MSIYKLTKIFTQNLEIMSIEKGLNCDIIKLQNKRKEVQKYDHKRIYFAR